MGAVVVCCSLSCNMPVVEAGESSPGMWELVAQSLPTWCQHHQGQRLLGAWCKILMAHGLAQVQQRQAKVQHSISTDLAQHSPTLMRCWRRTPWAVAPCIHHSQRVSASRTPRLLSMVWMPQTKSNGYHILAPAAQDAQVQPLAVRRQLSTVQMSPSITESVMTCLCKE